MWWLLRALPDVLRAQLDTGVRERALVAAGAVAAGGEAEGIGRFVADEGDPPVAELDQVRRRQLAAVDVVDDDRGERGVRRVDQHDRQPRRQQALDLVVGRDQGDDEQSIGAVAPVEELECVLPPIFRLDVEQHEVIRGARERGSDAAHALDRGRTREEGHHDADHLRSAQREVARDRAGSVVEGLDRVEHPRTCRRPDVRMPVQDARDGRDPDTGPGRHVGDRGVNRR